MNIVIENNTPLDVEKVLLFVLGNIEAIKNDELVELKNGLRMEKGISEENVFKIYVDF